MTCKANLLTFTLLLLANIEELVIGFLQPLATCGAFSDCYQCHAIADCKWCSLRVTVNAPKGAPKSYWPMGKCISKYVTCEDVKFGTLQGLSLEVGRIASLTLESSTLTGGKWCTPTESPAEVTVKTCGECQELGDDYGWCEAEYKVMTLVHRTGGVCIRKSLGFLCNAEIIPTLPPPFDLLKAEFIYYPTGEQCFSRRRPARPTAQYSCAENLSCDTCYRSETSCVWCGGEVTVPILDGSQSLRAGVFGRCVEATSAGVCAAVNFGDIPAKLLNDVKEQFGVVYSVDMIPKNSQICTTVQWPQLFAHGSCKSCIAQNGGWCEISLQEGSEKTNPEGLRRLLRFGGRRFDRESNEKSFDKTQVEKFLHSFQKHIDQSKGMELITDAAHSKLDDLSFEVGLCIDPTMKFVCTIATDRLQSTWMKDTCPLDYDDE